MKFENVLSRSEMSTVMGGGHRGPTQIPSHGDACDCIASDPKGKCSSNAGICNCDGYDLNDSSCTG